MNGLSWIIYLADVFQDAGELFAFLFGVTTIGGVVALICFVIWAACIGESYSDNQKVMWPLFRKFLIRFIVFDAIAIILCGVLVAALPSKNTMYAIAASEVGEEALKSPLATKTAKALEAWLDAQISKATKPAVVK